MKTLAATAISPNVTIAKLQYSRYYSWGSVSIFTFFTKQNHAKAADTKLGNVQFSNCPPMGRDRDINNGFWPFPFPKCAFPVGLHAQIMSRYIYLCGGINHVGAFLFLDHNRLLFSTFTDLFFLANWKEFLWIWHIAKSHKSILMEYLYDL